MNEEIETAPQINLMQIEFFSKKDFRFRSLVNNSSNENFLRAKNSWYKLPLKEVCYIEKILIFLDGYGSFDDFEVECILGEEVVLGSKIRIKDNTVEVRIEKFIACLNFRPQWKFGGGQIIRRVEFFGYRPEEIRYFEGKISTFDQSIGLYEQKLTSLSADQASLNTKLSEKKSDLDALEKQISGMIDEQERQSVKLSALQGEVSIELDRKNNLLENTKSIELNIQNLNKDKREIESNIRDKKSEYKKLVDEVRLFPSEISGVVSEGDRAMNKYFWIIGILGIIIASLIGHLIYGAWNFVSYASLPSDQVFSIFISRMPLATLYLIIISILMILLSTFADQIIRISTQRINVAAISMIAKDVSISSSTDTEMTDDERYEKEVSLKMELLRDHLKGYTSDGFIYTGKSTSQKILEFLTRKTKSSEGV
ncbi:MAG: hypothetical protein ACRDBL_01785 [Rhabdaerophilum sp.]